MLNQYDYFIVFFIQLTCLKSAFYIIDIGKCFGKMKHEKQQERQIVREDFKDTV